MTEIPSRNLLAWPTSQCKAALLYENLGWDDNLGGMSKMRFKWISSRGIPLAFIALVGANVLSMSLMNFFETSTKYTTLIYIACATSVVALGARAQIGLPKLTKKENLFCVALGVALFIPRLPYLFEAQLGYAVNPIGDDWLHLQEMVSLIQTPTFPPRSTFDTTKYLSYYYAPWMFGAALYGTGLLVSVKQALALTVLTYAVAASYSILYASKVLFSELRLQRAFVILSIFYGGFDFIYWLSDLTYLPLHSEKWANEFGFDIEYSNYFTLALWVQQHLIAAISVFLAVYIAKTSNTTAAAALVGLLLLSAAFSSVFVVMGAMPLLVWFIYQYRLIRAVPIAAVVFAAFGLPLVWIFLGRSGGTGIRLFGEMSEFWQDKKRAAFFVFLLIISLELLPLMMAAQRRIRQRTDFKWPFVLSVLFLLSTYVISIGYGENYSMRGSIVPIFVLTFLGTESVTEWFDSVRPRWIAITLLPYFLGGILEYAWFCTTAITVISQSNTELNAAIWKFDQGATDLSALQVRNRYTMDDRKAAWYALEKRGWPKDADPLLDAADSEIENIDVGYRITADRVWNGLTAHFVPSRSRLGNLTSAGS